MQNQTPVRNTYSRTRNQSGTLLAEPDTCLEHCKDSNNNYTNYSSGHPISEDPLPLPPYNLHFRLNFDYFFYLAPPAPHLLDVINVWPHMSRLFKVLKKTLCHRYLIGFWICLRFSINQDFACVRNFNRASQNILKRVLNIPPALNMPEFWISSGYNLRITLNSNIQWKL